MADETSAGADAVMPPGSTTSELARVLPTVSGRALDLGCGSGSLGILLARRGAETVVATDINPRACALARFNAVLNGVELDVREGDLYEPVKSERFGLIASQPPYALRPAQQPLVTYLHGGEYGDEIAMRVLGGAPDRLGPDGVAIVMFDSVVRKDHTLEGRVRSALEAHSVDLLAISAEGLPPDWQALIYAEVAEPGLGISYQGIAERYRTHLDSLGVAAVSHSIVVLHQRSKQPRSGWSIELGPSRLPNTWAQVESFMRGMDVAIAGDEELLAALVRPRTGASIEVRSALDDPAGDPSHAIAFPPGSIATRRAVSAAAAVLFQTLARDPSVAAAAEMYAAANGTREDDARAVVAGFVRMGLERGLLVPA